MKAKDLNDKQREEFAEEFYKLWPEGTKDDSESSTPWGCPWLHDEEAELIWTSKSDVPEPNISLAAYGYYKDNKKDILNDAFQTTSYYFYLIESMLDSISSHSSYDTPTQEEIDSILDIDNIVSLSDYLGERISREEANLVYYYLDKSLNDQYNDQYNDIEEPLSLFWDAK